MYRVTSIAATVSVCAFAILYASESYAQDHADSTANEHGEHANGVDAPEAGGDGHAMDHGDRDNVPRIIQFAGKFHPIAVHFPIALLLAAALSEAIGIMQKRNQINDVTYYCLLLGTLGAIVAAPLGWSTAWGAQYSEAIAGISVVLIHRVLGTAGAIAALITLFMAIQARRPDSSAALTPFRLALFFTASLIGITGHFGASLVFGLDYFSL